MIIIVDYKMGNLGSIFNMLRKIGAPAKISHNIDEIDKAAQIILPGVGAFDSGMTNIHTMGLLPVLHDKVVNRQTPILGICLGMQLLTRKSEEGKLPGLGFIAGETIRFRLPQEPGGLKVPHMGWNTVKLKRPHPLFQDILEDEDARFYFVHSYHVMCDQEADVLTTTDHGYAFVSSLHHGNILGTQFHPEKSHRYGLHLLTNFAGLS